MAKRPLVVLVAAAAALLGVVSIATGWRSAAAATGVAAIAAAWLVVSGGTEGTDGAVAVPAERPPPGAEPPMPESAAPAATPGGPVTLGLLDDSMLDVTLRSRVAVARRALRPLSLVHLDVIGGVAPAVEGEPIAELVTAVLRRTLREADACGRRADGVYVLVLEETGEDGAVWTAERVRRRLALTAGDRRFCAGIASYPSHGLDADGLRAKADAALDAARDWRRDRIEVAAGL